MRWCMARASSLASVGQERRGSRYTRMGMAKKKKIKTFRVVTAVKELARDRIGTPRPTQVVPGPKNRKKQKHKATLERLLDED